MKPTLVAACVAAMFAVTSAMSDDVALTLGVRATPDPLASLTHVTNDLLKQADALLTKATQLRNDYVKKGAALNDLNTKYYRQVGLRRNLTYDVTATGRNITYLDTYVRQNVASLNNRLSPLEHGVGLMARFQNDSIVGNVTGVQDSKYYTHLIPNSVAEFGQAFYNGSKGFYNLTTGYYTLPSSGVWGFTLTIERNDPDKDDCVEGIVMRNTGWMGVVSACPQGYSSASTLVVGWGSRGDHVYIRTAHQERIMAYVHTQLNVFKIAPH